MAKIIDGVAVAAKIRTELKRRVAVLGHRGIMPGLAVIMVGTDPASAVYVRNKMRACEEVGIRSLRFDFPQQVMPKEVLALIEDLNHRSDIHGILVQLPLPPQFKISEVLKTISADKDVDGFHLYNVGGLVVGGTVFPPCTPYGVVKLLEYERIPRGREECGRRRRQQHRGKTDGPHADAEGCHRLHLPCEDSRPGAVHNPCRRPRRRGW